MKESLVESLINMKINVDADQQKYKLELVQTYSTKINCRRAVTFLQFSSIYLSICCKRITKKLRQKTQSIITDYTAICSIKIFQNND
jgi:hypothetical protein